MELKHRVSEVCVTGPTSTEVAEKQMDGRLWVTYVS